MSKESTQKSRNTEKRKTPRSSEVPSPMVEIKFPGVPLYQLKIQDAADKGVGFIVRPDSNLLNHIKPGQILKVGLIAPSEDYQRPSGRYLSRIEHITEVKERPFRGHMLVGLSFLNQIKSEKI
jgi:hypothetical protein